ncbi:sulfatase-like hydrolase/transferase [Kriegella aquimaris]|uniref:Arylsulfatase A n=1 Tax=Kriegella aquimaris TaxID=192904 RepID=A0A1G9PYJ0_9FLAO|nr:sulfatase-like hydrolase/transferase [Kriegella aquimaris]SDM03848.1 Arylsulfatase A [Kriegella aquimaris]
MNLVKIFFKPFTTTLFLVSLVLTSCQTKTREADKAETLTSALELPDRPNILWLVTEDMGPYIPSFGDSTIVTPNLSRLAKEGVVYPNLFSTSGVCAPSRAAITTGMYPSSIGANHMRTTSYTEVTGLPSYGAVPPPEARMVSELLRMNGYYCSNNYKEDYQFEAPKTAWDESSPYAHWRNRDKNQPFFSIFNFTETHESGLFEPYGFRKIETRHYHAGDTTYTWETGRMTEQETTVHLPKDTEFSIPPYLPDTPEVHRDMWKTYNNIAEMDKQVGAVLKQLEEDGLLENTIIFFYGDHGGPLPREKRLIYDSGLNTPMIIRFPNKQYAGTKDDELLSFVDFAPTLLSLIGVNPPTHQQGQAFLGKYKSEKKRKYIHGAADRFDGFTDAIRAVRDDQFKYIRNYRPDQGYYLPVAYREKIPTMQQLLHLRDKGSLDSIQSLWFRDHKDPEELYDCKSDPYEVKNLAKDPDYREKLEELRTEMDRWLAAIGDRPDLQERELITRLWNGEESQPVTSEPVIDSSNDKITMSSTTEGASIGYKIIPENGKEPKVWSIYQEPFELPAETDITAQAFRIGFKPSKIVKPVINQR